MAKEYLFGYGSLINPDSRTHTGKTDDALLCEVKDIKREWNFRVPEAHVTALGATLQSNTVCNGVLIPIDTEELGKFDIREKGYTRVPLLKKNVELSNGKLPSNRIWAYLLDSPQKPNSQNPIIQSYIDVVLSGCITVGGGDFAKRFISTTSGWLADWIGDRANPKYPRAMKEVPLAPVIDGLLREIVPERDAYKIPFSNS